MCFGRTQPLSGQTLLKYQICIILYVDYFADCRECRNIPYSIYHYERCSTRINAFFTLQHMLKMIDLISTDSTDTLIWMPEKVIFKFIFVLFYEYTL